MKRRAKVFAELMLVLCMAITAYTTIMFLAVDSRHEVENRHLTLPANCEAGVWNHGSYLCWYTKREHPLWFALSLGGFIVAGWFLHKVHQSKNDDA